MVTLLVAGEPYRRSAGELSSSLVHQVRTTKTIRRLGSQVSSRVDDPDDGRRTLIELTGTGRALAESTLELVLHAFDLDIGDLGEAERHDLGAGLVRLSPNSTTASETADASASSVVPALTSAMAAARSGSGRPRRDRHR